MKPLLLDTYCKQGGASAGYIAAGFDVVGVDIEPQPKYPGEFVQADAVEFIARYGRDFDAIHASPPCQLHSATWRIRKNDHRDLIAATRDALTSTGRPYVIENVEDARPELRDPITLCGATFGLRMYRHRLFESSFTIDAPPHEEHQARQAKMGRPVRPGEFLHMVGNFSGVALAKEITGCHWMNRDGLRESIPPCYAEHVGAQLRAHLLG